MKPFAFSKASAAASDTVQAIRAAARDTARAMSQENVELVRRGWRAYESGDLTGLLDLLDPEIVVVREPSFPDAGAYQGKDGLLQAIIDWSENFDEFVMTAEEFIDLGGSHVLVRVHQDVTGTHSHIPVGGDFWFLHSVDNGRWTRVDMHRKKAEALQAARLPD